MRSLELGSKPLGRTCSVTTAEQGGQSRINGVAPADPMGGRRTNRIATGRPGARAMVTHKNGHRFELFCRSPTIAFPLFAALFANGRTTVIEKSASRDHTERLFNGFGVPVIVNGDLSITLDGPARFSGGAITIPGDVSSAAYFIAAAMLLPGSELTIDAVGLNPTRAAFLSVFKSLGGGITATGLRNERNEPVGTINVSGGLRSVPSDDARILSGAMIPSLIDELPLLAVVGTQVPGGIQIRDAEELRLKESDRLQATADNLRSMGAEVDEFDDGIAVSGPTQLHGAAIDSYNDHRIAMAFSVAALLAEGETEIAGAECVAISFPEFFTLLESLAKR